MNGIESVRSKQNINKVISFIFEEEISKHKKKEKLFIIERIKDEKLKLLDYTRTIFKKILSSDSSRANL